MHFIIGLKLNFIKSLIPLSTIILCFTYHESIKLQEEKQGPIQHKPWPIKKIADFQDSLQLTRQMQTVKKVSDCQGSH